MTAAADSSADQAELQAWENWISDRLEDLELKAHETHQTEDQAWRKKITDLLADLDFKAEQESLFQELEAMTKTWAEDWQQALGEHLGQQIAAEGPDLRIYRGAEDDGG